MTGKRRAPRITAADRPWWPIATAQIGSVYLIVRGWDVITSPTFVDGMVTGVSAAMLVLTFAIAPRRDAYERHLSEAVCVHRRDADPQDPHSAE